MYDISAYVTGALMYEYMCGDAPNSLHDFFQTNSDVHSHDHRSSTPKFVTPTALSCIDNS